MYVHPSIFYNRLSSIVGSNMESFVSINTISNLYFISIQDKNKSRTRTLNIRPTFEFCLDTVLGVGSKSGPISFIRSSWRVLEPRLAEFRFGLCRATGRFILADAADVAAAAAAGSWVRNILGLWSRDTWPEIL